MLCHTNILVTIGITVYNEGEYILEAWDSVLNQSDDRWVAIMVLDGGADQKTKIYFDLIQHPKLTKFSFLENQGPYVARTKAIELTQTKWYCHLDGDDLLPNNMVHDITRVIIENPNSVYILGRSIYFNRKYFITRNHKGLKDPRLAYTLPFCGTAPIKCELFNKLGGYNKDLYSGGADRDFWISVFESNEEGVCINKIIYERRIRENSFGYKRSNKRHLVAQILVDGHPEYFSDINRENICLSKGFEQSARFHRKIGKRKKAMELAQVAIDYGSKNESLTNIIYEGNMSIGRYILRRIGRFIK